MAKSDRLAIRLKKFRQGIDLGSDTRLTGIPIEEMPAPEKLYVPLKQHAGPVCEPKVKKGSRVLMGQLLAESADPEAAPVHAPVSGEVEAVMDHPDPFGRMVPTLIIKNDGQDEWETEPTADPDFTKMKLSAVIRAVRQSGLVQVETGRPINTMLSPPERPKAYIFLVGIPMVKPVEILIVQAMDNEPTTAVNRRLLLDQPSELAEAIALTKKIAGAKEAVLVVDKETAQSAGAVETAAGDAARIVVMDNRYPVARDMLLTTAITGREVPWPGGEPRDVGALVLEVNSLMGLLDAVKCGRPKIDQVVVVSGAGVLPRNLRVRLGTPLDAVLAHAGASFDQSSKVIIGGLMDGMALYTGQAPVTKQVTALRAIDEAGLVRFSEHLCIKCGRCITVCPVRILPNVVTNYCEFGYFDEADEAGLFACIECGCCAYVCPAKRPLVHYVKHGKAEMTAQRTAI